MLLRLYINNWVNIYRNCFSYFQLYLKQTIQNLLLSRLEDMHVLVTLYHYRHVLSGFVCTDLCVFCYFSTATFHKNIFKYKHSSRYTREANVG